MAADAPTAVAGSSGSPDLSATLIRVAWLSVLLGLVMEILVLAVGASLQTIPGLNTILADTVQKVSWSTVVCVGLAIGTAASKARVPAMGLAGLLAAPVAFNLARSLHKSVAQALQATVTVSANPSALVLAILKGVQYGCLGMALGWVGRSLGGGVTAYLAGGLGVGILFGGATLILMSPLPLETLVARGINEVLFPMGCSLVLFASEALGKKATDSGK